VVDNVSAPTVRYRVNSWVRSWRIDPFTGDLLIIHQDFTHGRYLAVPRDSTRPRWLQVTSRFADPLGSLRPGDDKLLANLLVTTPPQQ